jgi:protein SCO1/2
LSSWLYGLSPTPAQLDAALAQATAGRSGGVMQQLMLLCFHYDPRTGRYSLAITEALRFAGIATVLLIALAIGLLSPRRKKAT